MNFSNKLFSYDPVLQLKQMNLDVCKIMQVSELSLLRGSEMPEHIQACDEITYAISGTAKIYSGNDCCDLHTGEIHYIKKDVPHKIVANDETNFRYICIGFIPDSNCTDIQIFTDAVKDINWFISNDTVKLKLTLEMLFDELYIADTSTPSMLSAYMKQILISTARLYNGKEALSTKESNSTSNFAVYNVLKYIDRNYASITNTKQISEALSYSNFYISHLFKEKIGLSVKEYLTQKKMIAAAHFLAENNLAVSEVSEQLSFGTTHTFSQAFKKYYGVSPTEYKKQQQILD